MAVHAFHATSAGQLPSPLPTRWPAPRRDGRQLPNSPRLETGVERTGDAGVQLNARRTQQTGRPAIDAATDYHINLQTDQLVDALRAAPGVAEIS